MIASLLRRPRGPGEIAADLVRVAGVLSIAAAAIWWGVEDALIFVLVLLGLLVPRLIRVRPVFDIFFGITLLVAAWSGVLSLYASVTGWDIVVHFTMNGATAAMIYLLLARLRIVPLVDDDESPFVAVIILTVTFGFGTGALWELTEWAGHNFIDDAIFVAYDDTIGDLAAGGFGALVAGCAMKLLSPRGAAARASTSGSEAA